MKKIDSINIIPFIDIMLVLFTIVLMSATFITQGKIKVDLPEASKSSATQKEKEIFITIKKNGEIYFDEKKVEEKELEKEVSKLAKESLVAIKADKESNFKYFVTVLDLLKAKNMNNLSIITTKGD